MKNSVINSAMVMLLLVGAGCQKPAEQASTLPPGTEAISLLGQPLRSSEPAPDLVERSASYAKAYREDSSNLENIVWHGRFTAYQGRYREAVRIYSDGLKLYPDESRLYRHRGHRYITLRMLDQAVADLSRAAQLIQGEENSFEPDGLPNERNTPVSTRHGNIWYHLGLAHYLKQDMPSALRAFQRALDSSENDDNIVSCTHWLYMILRRMNRQQDADALLDVIHEKMDIIENIDYLGLCLFYKGILSHEQLTSERMDSDAINYGVGNWYYYNGNEDRAAFIFNNIIRQGKWDAFGSIAAEAQLAMILQKR